MASKPAVRGQRPNMSRDTSKAGQRVQSGGYTVTYDENGYAKKAIHDNGASATSRPHTSHANDSATHQQMYQEAQKGNWDEVGRLSNNLITGPKTDYQTGDGAKANEYVGELQKEFGYNSHDYYKQKYEAIGGKGTWDDPDHHLPIVMPSQAPSAPSSANDGWNVVGQPNAAPGAPGGSGGGYSGGGFISGGGAPIRSQSFGNYLDTWFANAQKQQDAKIDYAAASGIRDLVRAEEDAQSMFQTQRNQIAIDEAQARDKQAMYAQARGDRGGIGQAQYDAIANTAAQNRLTVNSAQTKLATDTARQIQDLRTKSEFEKADALLELTQTYLAQLISLEQWAAEYQMSVDQFNAQLSQWAAEYEMQKSQITGEFQGKPTFAATQAERKRLSDDGWAFLGAGVLPSAEQLQAMGMTKDQAAQVLRNQKAALAAKQRSAGGGGPRGPEHAMGIDALMQAAQGSETPDLFIAQNAKEYGLEKNDETSIDNLIQNYYDRGYIKFSQLDESRIANRFSGNKNAIFVLDAQGRETFTSLGTIDRLIDSGEIRMIPQEDGMYLLQYVN